MLGPYCSLRDVGRNWSWKDPIDLLLQDAVEAAGRALWIMEFKIAFAKKIDVGSPSGAR
jgi:hypothetical protein